MSEETRDFTPKAVGKIIQLDYDLITSLDGSCCYCLTDAQVQMILGVMDYFGWVSRWYSAAGTVDKQTILDLQGGLTEALMCGCCNDNSVLSQWTPNGHYQTSTDGGATWQDTPSSDPRNPQTTFPPFVPPDTVDDSCTYADSVVQFIKTRIVALIDDVTTADQVISVITSAVGTILALLSATVIGGIIIALLGAVALLIGIAGGAAFKAAFTDSVWNRLRCNIKNHMGTDGSFTQANIDGIYTKIGADESGLTALFLQQIIAMMGVVGVTNAARSGLGAPDADCSSCDTACSVTGWSIYPDEANRFGHITAVDPDAGTITVETTNINTDSNYYIIIQSPADNTCCQWLGFMGASPSRTTPTLCGNPRATGAVDMTAPQCINTLLISSPTPFTVTMIMADCP